MTDALFYLGNHPIRERADVERAGFTWDRVLDLVADRYVDDLSDPKRFHFVHTLDDSVISLLPEGERAAARANLKRRIHAAWERHWTDKLRRWEVQAAAEGARRRGPPGILSWLFGWIFR